MPEFLLEILSEEIPARMQSQAARDLEAMGRKRLAEAGYELGPLCVFAGPRRLTLLAQGLPTVQSERTEQRRGPKLEAPEQAVQGFLRSTGLARDQLIVRDGVLYAETIHPGRPTVEVLAEVVLTILQDFPWPKSMRWGQGSFRWVRPLRRLLCLFDGAIVPVEIEGVRSGASTEGHRFMGDQQGPFEVRDFASYRSGLDDRFVMLDQVDRKQRIASRAHEACAELGLELVEDEGLLEEVSGLAEWPTPVVGAMDAAFLFLPPEVIRTSMRSHQKYFAVRDLGGGELAPRFVVVANIEPDDGGAVLAAGNAKVLSARLNDATFFWREDMKVALERRLQSLDGVTFHAKLGSMRRRVERIEALAEQIAPLVGADTKLAVAAAHLCKADLATLMVREFPELQGIMGGYYVRAEGSSASGPHVDAAWSKGFSKEDVDAVADAVRDHYKPIGPSDDAPTAPVTVAVALADKLDTLVSFFAIDERPTGSRDPYALRRAALGAIRIILAAKLKVPLSRLVQMALESAVTREGPLDDKVVPLLLAFLAERLKVLLREEGRRHDLIEAVFALDDDDLVARVGRVNALTEFLSTDGGASLLAGYRRAVNLLKAESKGPGDSLSGAEAPPPLQEKALAEALADVQSAVDDALKRVDFINAMEVLAQLQGPVDAFFESVLVNDKDPQVRLRRLRLLSQVRDTANRVADFSLVSG